MRRSFIPYIVTSAVLFGLGVVLGAGRSSDDASAANTASKILLTIGLVAAIVTTILEVVARRRARRADDGETRIRA